MNCKKENIRLKNVLQNDQIAFTNEILQLISSDLSVALCDYFHLTENPNIQIRQCSDGYEIVVSAKADYLRSFSKVI